MGSARCALPLGPKERRAKQAEGAAPSIESKSYFVA